MSKPDIQPQDQYPRRSSPADVHFPDHGLTVIESHHAETFHMERKQWPFHKFCWVAMGRGLLELDQGVIPIQRDQFLLLPAGLEHRFVDHHTDPLTLVIACMDERFLVPGRRREAVWQAACASLPPGRPCRARGAFQHSKMVDQLKPQMTRRQVRFVLGTPIIEDTFNADRWDYVHVVRLGNENLSRSQLTVVFEGDVLIDVEGDLVSDNWPEKDAETEGS